MIKLKPNLNLVGNDCFIEDISICMYKKHMTFEELMEVLLHNEYGKVAYDPMLYSLDEQFMIRKMAERNLIVLVEFPSSNRPLDNSDIVFSNPYGVRRYKYSPKEPEDNDFDFSFDEISEFEDKDESESQDIIEALFRNLQKLGGIEIKITKK